jgi:pilus assembly protein CpaB
MNRNRMLLVGLLALVMSLALAYLVWRTAGPSHNQTGKIVVVAKEKISPGSLLTAKDLKTLPWPLNVLIKGSFTDPKELENRITMVEMFENDFVVESKLVPKEGGVGGLTAVIDPDKRAVSVKVDSVIGVAGFVLPGTYVDVIATGQPRPDGDLTSKVIIENVRVLTADKDLEKDPEGKARDSRVVTLLLDPEQAQKVALASTDSHIQLALRNPRDTGIENPPAISKPDLYSGRSAIKTESSIKTGKVTRRPIPRPKRETDRGFLMISGGKEQKLTLDDWQVGATCSTSGRKP